MKKRSGLRTWHRKRSEILANRGSATAGFSVFLNRRAGDCSIRAEHAAVARPGRQHGVAAIALVKPLARIRRHGLALGMSAMRAVRVDSRFGGVMRRLFACTNSRILADGTVLAYILWPPWKWGLGLLLPIDKRTTWRCGGRSRFPKRPEPATQLPLTARAAPNRAPKAPPRDSSAVGLHSSRLANALPSHKTNSPESVGAT